MGIHRRRADPECPENHEADSREDQNFGRAQRGPESAGVQLRGLHHHVRPHAGGGDGERSCGELFPVRADRENGRGRETAIGFINRNLFFEENAPSTLAPCPFHLFPPPPPCPPGTDGRRLSTLR